MYRMYSVHIYLHTFNLWSQWNQYWVRNSKWPSVRCTNNSIDLGIINFSIAGGTGMSACKHVTRGSPISPIYPALKLFKFWDFLFKENSAIFVRFCGPRPHQKTQICLDFCSETDGWLMAGGRRRVTWPCRPARLPVSESGYPASGQFDRIFAHGVLVTFI